MTKVKRSLITGALASSFGIFISKVLGLLYVVPLNHYAGDANMAFYSIAYTYYDLLLKISTAGIPFAIAALVAKYISREDYKTALLVKKLGSSLLLLTGFVVALIFVLIANPLSNGIMGEFASKSDITTLRNLFYILSLAILLVPFLSALRGYVQGLKLLSSYAASQVLEQFFRVFTIIIFSIILVGILKLDGVYAIYVAILAASIGAIASLIYIYLIKRKSDHEIKELALSQTRLSRNSKEIIKELLSIGLPYLFIATIAYIPAMINANLFIELASSAGFDYEEVVLSYGITSMNVAKIISIPNVFAMGFSSGMVPYLTESFEKRDAQAINKHINDILNTLLFILIPFCLWLIVYSKLVYAFLYGTENIMMADVILKMSLISILLMSLLQALSTILITLKCRRTIVKISFTTIVVKFISFYILVRLLSYKGMILSDIIESISILLLYYIVLRRDFRIKFKMTARFSLITILVSLVSCLPALAFNLYQVDLNSKLIILLNLGGLGMLSFIIFVLIADYVGLIKVISAKTLKEHIEGLKVRFRR